MITLSTDDIAEWIKERDRLIQKVDGMATSRKSKPKKERDYLIRKVDAAHFLINQFAWDEEQNPYFWDLDEQQVASL